MSRYKKIPYYMSITKTKVSKEKINEYQNRFSEIVVNKVIESDWVKGSYEFIKKKSRTHRQYIISATPKGELDDILKKINLREYIDGSYGSPTNKVEAIRKVLNANNAKESEAIFIGDGSIDYEAATALKIDFILIQNKENQSIQKIVPKNSQIDNFSEIVNYSPPE